MFCEVQRLYERGLKKGQPLPPVAGELSLRQWRNGSNDRYPRFAAALSKQDGELAIPAMVDAVVVKITESGIVVLGTEVVPRNSSYKSNVEYYSQTWWCKVLPGRPKIEGKLDNKSPWRTAAEHTA